MDHPEIDLGALERGVNELIARERGPRAWLRALPRPGRFTLVVLVAAAMVAFFYFTSRRADFDVYPPWRMAAALAALAGLCTLAVWESLRPIYQPPRAAWWTGGLLAAGLLVPVLLGILPELPTLNPRYRGLPSDLICLKYGLLFGLAVFAGSWLLMRDGRGLVLGALAGALTGILVLQVECPYNSHQHLLAGHATIGPLLVLGGLAVRRIV